MFERIINKGNDWYPDWVVLAEDMREVIFSGTFEECQRWVRTHCENCEE